MTLVCLTRAFTCTMVSCRVRSSMHVCFVNLDLHVSDAIVMSVIKVLRTTLSKDYV